MPSFDQNSHNNVLLYGCITWTLYLCHIKPLEKNQHELLEKHHWNSMAGQDNLPGSPTQGQPNKH